MKIALSADWQFASYPSLSTVLPSGITSRLHQLQQAWGWYIHQGADLGCDTFSVLGDIYNDRTVIDLPVLDVVPRCFRDLRDMLQDPPDADSSAIIVAGNHDSYLRNTSINSLQGLAGYSEVVDEDLLVWEHGFKEEESGDEISAGLVFMPWKETDEQIEGAVEEALKRVSHCHRKYLFSHFMLAGLFGNAGHDRDLLRPSEWTHIFLGDVHDHMTIDNNITYVGSPLQLTFGDAGKDRGFIVLDLDTGDWTHEVNEESPKFHTLNDGTTEGYLKNIRPCDFVRFKDASAETVQTLAPLVREIGCYLREDAAEHVDEDDEVRLGVRHSDNQETTLRRFVEYHQFKNKDDVDRLTDLGVDILKEVRS